MKLIRYIFPLIVLSVLGFSQEGPLVPDPPKGISAEQIIQKFAAKEKEFKEARDNYTFRQEVRVQTLDGDTVTGEYREVFDVTYDDKRRHLENVVFAPQSTLDNGGISMSPEDLQDIRHLLPFVLTSDEIPEYDVLYVGLQIEGQYWFPAYNKADDTLHFKLNDVHIREIVKYTDYKRFGSKTRVIYQGKDLPREEQKPGQQPSEEKPQN